MVALQVFESLVGGGKFQRTRLHQTLIRRLLLFQKCLKIGIVHFLQMQFQQVTCGKDLVAGGTLMSVLCIKMVLAFCHGRKGVCTSRNTTWIRVIVWLYLCARFSSIEVLLYSMIWLDCVKENVVVAMFKSYAIAELKEWRRFCSTFSCTATIYSIFLHFWKGGTMKL